MKLIPTYNENIKNKIKSNIKRIIKVDEKLISMKKDMDEGGISPFIEKLFDRKTILIGKVLQSLYTTMGMSFYEQTAKIIGELAGYEVFTQKKLFGKISNEVENYISLTLDDIRYKPNRKAELEKVKTISKIANPQEYPDSTVDVYIITPDNKEFLIDITTVKPNKKEFRELKRKTLRWAAMRNSQEPKVDVEPYFAIPYNPESPDIENICYERWKPYYDRKDILVGEEFWRKVSNNLVGIKDIEKILTKISEELENTTKLLNI